MTYFGMKVLFISPTHKRTEGRAPVWGSEFFFKRRCTTRGGDGGAQAIVRGGARCVSQVLHRCAQPVSRGAARCASQVNDLGAHADADAPRMYLIVVYRPFPALPRRRSLCVACTWPWCQDRCLRP